MTTTAGFDMAAEATRNALFAGLPGHAELIRSYAVRYGPPMLGGTRAVFDRADGTVVKVAFNDEGMRANARESAFAAAQPSGPGEGVRLASCALCWDGDTSVLVMDRVDLAHGIAHADLPGWTGWVDCAQVGLDSDGTLVAYDL